MGERTQKSIRNISIGIIYQIISVISSFICRTAMLHFLGIDIISLHGLYWQIVSMLSLAELGIGSAIVYHLYKPLADGNVEQIKRIMGLYKKCYRIIAGICFIGGSVVTIIVPIFVNGLSYSNTYLRCIFFLYVIQMSVSYLFIADTALLQADQNRYKTVYIQIVFLIGSTSVALLILYFFRSFVLYLIANIISTVLMNFFCSQKAIKTYPYLKEKYTPLSKEEAKQIFVNVRDIFSKKIAGYVTNSTDNICISVLVGTIQVGFYSNYAMLFNAVLKLEQQISSGFSASMGDLAAKESPSHIDSTLQKMTIYFQLFGMIMSSGLLACSSTFINIWIGEKYILVTPIIVVCCINIYLSIVKDPLWQTMDACGLFSYDRNLAIISTLMNLVISISLGIKYGMTGIFIGTAVSTIFEIIFKSIGIYKRKLHLSAQRFRIIWVKMIFSEIFILFIGYWISTVQIVNLYLRFIIQGSSVVVLSVIVWMVIFLTSHKKEILHFYKSQNKLR